MYYRGAAAAIVVYDITKKVYFHIFIYFLNESFTYFLKNVKDSFNGAKSWVKELQRRGDPNVVIALAGNKADMESKRKVQLEEAAQYALESDILHMETSAKTALNVRELFVQIGNSIYMKILIISFFKVILSFQQRNSRKMFLFGKMKQCFLSFHQSRLVANVAESS